MTNIHEVVQRHVYDVPEYVVAFL